MLSWRKKKRKRCGGTREGMGKHEGKQSTLIHMHENITKKPTVGTLTKKRNKRSQLDAL